MQAEAAKAGRTPDPNRGAESTATLRLLIPGRREPSNGSGGGLILNWMRGTSLHQDYSRKLEGKASSDRSFGIVFAIFFALAAFSPLRAHRPVRWWAFAVAGFFLAIALLQPGWLRPMNRVWTKLGLFLGRAVSP